SRGLERDLLGAGESIVRVPPKLMAGMRRSGRERGKSDPLDGLAGAPAAHLDGPEREVRLLVDHREDLVSERTRVENRLHWHLHELDPTVEIGARTLGRYVVLDGLAARIATHEGRVAEIAGELVER